MEELEFEAAVGLSRKWDAREAGREVARNTIQKLSHPPSFFLLFSTIHYETHGGFQEFLNGVWDVLPKETPLIGGTVGGFINPYGVYTRGATGFAVYSNNLDVATGIGHNTKRSPKKAANKCAEMIRNKLDNSCFKNKFSIVAISGAKTLNFPGLGRKKVMNIPTGSYISKLAQLSTVMFQHGVARSEKIFQVLDKKLEEFYVIGGETTDNNEVRENFQFIGNKVFPNSIVALGVATDLNIDLISNYDTGPKVIHKAKVTKKSCWNHVICEINGKPAKEELLHLLGWPEEYMDERIYRRVFFYPVGYADNSRICPHVMGAFWGDYIILEYAFEGDVIGFPEYSGKTLRDSLDDTIGKLMSKEQLFGFGAACIASMEALGASTYFIQKKFSDTFDGMPYLFLYLGGEDAKLPNNSTNHMNYSFNMLSLNRE